MSIELTDITGGEVEGRGFYDELMRTTKAHLEDEFEKGRITGSDYATVYLGAMQANLQTAANVVLQYELNNKQLEILEQQRLVAIQNVIQSQEQVAKLRAEVALLEDELANLRPKQALQLTYQNDLIQEQVLGQTKQNALLDSQKTGQDNQNLLILEQTNLVNEQVKTEAANTVGQVDNEANPNYITGLVGQQIRKSQAEADVLEQRKITEEAQTVGDKTTIGGAIGAQIALQDQQRKGFIRDAEQKAAKILADSFSVAHSITPETYVPSDYKLDGPACTSAVTTLLNGLNDV